MYIFCPLSTGHRFSSADEIILSKPNLLMHWMASVLGLVYRINRLLCTFFRCADFILYRSLVIDLKTFTDFVIQGLGKFFPISAKNTSFLLCNLKGGIEKMWNISPMLCRQQRF